MRFYDHSKALNPRGDEERTCSMCIAVAVGTWCVGASPGSSSTMGWYLVRSCRSSSNVCAVYPITHPPVHR
jgi:hypothetical protein